ncbi:MAG: lysostaphin resistance A-like protein [Planctomycetota bacterium]
MNHSSRQLSVANTVPTIGSAPFFGIRLKRLDASLLMETAAVTIAAILAIKVLNESSLSRAIWFMAPGILIAAALVPTAIKGNKLPKIGFDAKQIKLTLRVVCWTCAVVFPAMFCVLWLLKSYGLHLPLRPVPPQGQGWAGWLLYQFMYIAVAEEVFFRGYVQNNILKSTSAIIQERRRLLQWIIIIISAACFAAAHIIIQGKIISALIFLPGLILGWLFIRTKSLLAPILFHGLANVYYFCVAAVFA